MSDSLVARRFANAREALAVGMSIAFTAGEHPERDAILSEHGDRTFGELNERANRLVRALRARGVGPGAAIALVCTNRPEFAEVYAAALRGGYRFTCINWHLKADEIAYIVEDCEAQAFLADERVAQEAGPAAAGAPSASLRLAIGGPIAGFESYEEFIAEQPSHDIQDPTRGSAMLYTSGTTGRPKGVYRKTAAAPAQQPREPRPEPLVRGESLVLCTGPLYHAAPLQINLTVPLLTGVGVVLMDKWDAEDTLRLIERHRVTHTHMVATMFHRLLALPKEVRERYDISSLRYVVHGAAPTPVHVKQALIDWLGLIVYEYYAATEGGGTFITPEEWLRKPGSVGQPNPGRVVEIRSGDGELLPTGEIGTVYFTTPEVGAFEYFKAPEKTSSAYLPDKASFTLGDHGYIDDDGYVFLTGRTSELIISAGVNIYPAEVDAVLLMHPSVADVATVGVPNDEWGEEVKSVVQPAEGIDSSPTLADDLIRFCRERLARYKCPRTIDFDPELPRSDAGKIVRRKVRDRYWDSHPL